MLFYVISHAKLLEVWDLWTCLHDCRRFILIMVIEGTFKTPRPVPLIPAESATFSRKKRGSSTFSPPKPPAKSAPPISRVFRHTRNSSTGPQSVSFKDKDKTSDGILFQVI